MIAARSSPSGFGSNTAWIPLIIPESCNFFMRSVTVGIEISSSVAILLADTLPSF